MKKFIISTDSCSDHFKSYLEANDVHYIILKRITSGITTEEMYDSLAEFEDFYEKIRKGALPTTSQLNEYELNEYFQKLLQSGQGDIVHLSLSSGVSGTCQNAISAAEQINKTLAGRKIYVIDSLSASRGIGMLVDRLIEMRNQGLPSKEAVRLIEEVRDRQQLWAIIGDLRHLKRGGRISSFKAVVGTFFNVKPILIINAKGKLIIEKAIKGEKKSIKYILDKMEKYGALADVEFSKQTIYLAHSGDNQLVAGLEKAIKERFGDIKIDKGMIGPIVGTHVGDGTAAIIFEGAKRIDID